jgi:hypothetical protein
MTKYDNRLTKGWNIPVGNSGKVDRPHSVPRFTSCSRSRRRAEQREFFKDLALGFLLILGLAAVACAAAWPW